MCDGSQAVLDRVAALRATCDATLAEKDRLAAETELTKKRLIRADKLTSGLAGEQVRWKASVERFDSQIAALVGDVLLAAGCVSYYGPFTGSFREGIVSEWNEQCISKKIPCSPTFSLMVRLHALLCWHLLFTLPQVLTRLFLRRQWVIQW